MKLQVWISKVEFQTNDQNKQISNQNKTISELESQIAEELETIDK